MTTLIPTPALRSCLHVLAAALLTCLLTSCLTLESVSCSPELSCQGGMTCAAAQDVCISALSPSCGNGVLEAGEACDDGNLKDKDLCSADCKSDESCGNGIIDIAVGEVCDIRSSENGNRCSSDCKSVQGCGNGYVDPGEQCDNGQIHNSNTGDCLVSCNMARCGDGFTNSSGELTEECDPRDDPTGCDLDCTLRACNDGTINAAAGEQCERPGPHADFFCTSTCKISRCGDGLIDSEAGEVCDDGNTVTESQCPYGTATCTPCRADCQEKMTLRGPSCGDGVRNGMEACDDGNTTTEKRCPYGSPTCQLCNASCQGVLDLEGDYCGDGIHQAEELCDDGNADACGTCSADCQRVQRKHAWGFIIAPPGAPILEGEEITISDGSKTARIEFTKSQNPETRPGYRRIQVTQAHTAVEVAKLIRDAVKNLSETGELNITGIRDDVTVNLENKELGAYANQTISQSPPKHAVQARGMIEGQARNCPDSVACTQKEDCEPSLTCRTSGNTGLCSL